MWAGEALRCHPSCLPCPTAYPVPLVPPRPRVPCAARTHRELFSIWYADLPKEPLEDLPAAAPRPAAAERFFHQMMRDINGACEEPVQQVRGALGGRGLRVAGAGVGAGAVDL